jgi:replicative DNA helicase
MSDGPQRHDPWDIPLEQALLGSILVENKVIDRAELLKPEHFYDPLHARIYQAILVATAVGQVTPLTLHAALKADPGLIEVGGAAYLFGLASAAPAMPNIKDYVRVLIDLWGRRELIGVGERLVSGAHEAPDESPSQGLTDAAVRDLLALGSSYRADRTQPLAAVMRARLHAAERRLAGEAIPTVTTGLRRLDRALGGGLQPGDHMVLCGRSGSGKSALAICMGRAAAQAGHPVLAICADMTRERWADRTNTDLDHLMRHGANPLHYGRFRGRMAEQDIERLYNAMLSADHWAYDICDEGEITTARIRSKVRAMANRYPGQPGLLITDFLQKLKRPERRKDQRRDEEITDTVYEIGDIVKDAGWSALSLAQLKNKDTDSKGKLNDRAPEETDIRECVTGDTRVIDADTGVLTMVRDLRPGTRIVGINSQDRTEPGIVSDVWRTGRRSIFELVTNSGRRVRATANHPIFTARGWVRLGDLQSDDLIAIAFRLCHHGKEIDSAADLCRLAGYIVGDGTCQKGKNPGLIISEPSAFADAMSIIGNYFPDVAIRRKATKYNDVYFSNKYGRGRGKQINTVTAWLKEIGLFGHRDYTKFVPEMVFRAGQVGAIEFLNGYLATDGCISHDEIRFDTTSLCLALDVVHLLSRLGAAATVSRGYIGKKATRNIYRVLVSYEHRELISRLLTVRGIRGERLERLGRNLRERPKCSKNSILSLPVSAAARAFEIGAIKYSNVRLGRKTCRRIAAKTSDYIMQKWAYSDIAWTGIRSIESVGEDDVYDLSIPALGSFIANGIVVHNSGGILMAADICAAIHRRAYFVERKEPPGRDFSPAPPADWLEWEASLREVEHEAQIIGFKNRDDSVSRLHLTLWCEMAANAFRDERPIPGGERIAQQEMADLIR